MRYSFVSALPAVLSLLSFSTAYSVPPQRPQEVLAGQSYSCPGAQSVSLCCSRRVKTNGGVDDCEKSLHFVIRAADDHSYLTNSVRTCSGDQVSRGYDRPVCCRSHFQPAVSGVDDGWYEAFTYASIAHGFCQSRHELCGRFRRRQQYQLEIQSSPARVYQAIDRRCAKPSSASRAFRQGTVSRPSLDIGRLRNDIPNCGQTIST